MSTLNVLSPVLRNYLGKLPHIRMCSGKTTAKEVSPPHPDDYISRDPGEIDDVTTKTDMTALFIDDVEDERDKKRRIAAIRNISRLEPQHKNMVHNVKPYKAPQSWIHTTLKYNRIMFGRYGMASAVDPRLCFYSETELDERNEYERVAYPYTIQELMKRNADNKAAEKQAIIDRENEIDKKLQKLDQWSRELNEKVAKREAEAKAAKERKERLVEEVRRQFGFKMDARDERFQEMLAQKDKEDRKKQKEIKRKQKEEKMLAKLMQKNDEIPVEAVEANVKVTTSTKM